MVTMSLQLHPQVLGTNPQPIDTRLRAIIQNLLDMQINPFQSVLVVTGAEFNELQEKGRAWIAEHLSDHLQKDVLWAQDGTRDTDRYFVGPPEDFLSGNRMLINIDGRAVLVFRPPTKKSPPQSAAVKDVKSPVKEKLSRPSNPFLLYRRDYHKIIKEANPEYNNNQISIVLGASWKEEKQEVKDRYIQMAAEVKAEFMRAHPDYRYTPRRAGERPRRKKRDPVQPTHHEAMSQPVSIATQHAPDLK